MRNRNSVFRVIPLAAAAALMGAGPARPATLVYTDASQFLAAAGSNTTTIGFEGIAAPGTADYFGFTGLNIDGVDITSTDSQLFTVSSTWVSPQNAYAGLNSGDYMEGAYASTCCGTGSTIFSFTDDSYAFGLDFRAYNQSDTLGGSFTFTLSNGDSFVEASPDISNFVGFISSVPLLSVSVTPNGDNPNRPDAEFFHFDNVTVDTQSGLSSAPEPSTGWLGAGCLLAGLFLRARRPA